MPPTARSVLKLTDTWGADQDLPSKGRVGQRLWVPLAAGPPSHCHQCIARGKWSNQSLSCRPTMQVENTASPDTDFFDPKLKPFQDLGQPSFCPRAPITPPSGEGGVVLSEAFAPNSSVATQPESYHRALNPQANQGQHKLEQPQSTSAPTPTHRSK